MGDKQVVYVVVEGERAMEPFLACEVQYHLEIDTDGTPEERKAFAGAVREALEAGRKNCIYTRDDHIKRRTAR